MMYTILTKFEDGSKGKMEHMSHDELLTSIRLLDKSLFAEGCVSLTVIPEK